MMKPEPMRKEDRRGVEALWLSSYMGAMEAKKLGEAYWTTHREVVERLMETSAVDVLYTEDGAIMAFLVRHPDLDVVHFGMIKRDFIRDFKEEMSLALSPTTDAYYTHHMPDFAIPRGWVYAPHLVIL